MFVRNNRLMLCGVNFGLDVYIRNGVCFQKQHNDQVMQYEMCLSTSILKYLVVQVRLGCFRLS